MEERIRSDKKAWTQPRGEEAFRPTVEFPGISAEINSKTQIHFYFLNKFKVVVWNAIRTATKPKKMFRAAEVELYQLVRSNDAYDENQNWTKNKNKNKRSRFGRYMNRNEVRKNVLRS